MGVWNGLSEFLMVVMPLIDVSGIRRFLTKRLLPKTWAQTTRTGDSSVCGFCSMSPMTMPVQNACGHAFCYYCLASERMENPNGAACPRCSTPLGDFALKG